MNDTRNPIICRKESFPEYAKQNGIVFDVFPVMPEGQTEVTGRCHTVDKEKRNVQYTLREWAPGEFSLFCYDHRTKQSLFLTTSKPDRRSPTKLGAYNTAVQAAEADKLRIEQEELARLKQQWESYQPFKPGENVPYLENKGLRPCSSFRRDGDNLVADFRDVDTGKITNIQRIYPDGRKYGDKDRSTKNIYHVIPGLKEVPYVLVAEGVATAAAAWASTHATTYSAHDCGNMTTVAKMVKQKHPRHKVVICADNDRKNEAKDGVNQGLEAGRKAAYRSGGILALPPYEGHDRNWDICDMYKEQGPDAVRELIENSLRAEGCEFPEEFEVDERHGLLRIVTLPRGGTKLVEIGPFIEVKAYACTDTREKYGKVVSWKKPGGDMGRAVLMIKDITSRDPKKLRTLLDSYEVVPSKQGLLADYLAKVKPEKCVEIISQHGWHGDAYAVSPNQIIGDPEGTKLAIFGGRASDYEQEGTLADWKSNVAYYTRGNPILTLVHCISLAGPLHEMAGAESGGTHLVGFSSTGKSTGVKVGQSAWSSKFGMYTWRSTDNALESIAAAHNHCLLSLDEFGQCEDRIVGQTVYMLGNGQGKVRGYYADETIQANEPLRWNLSLLSSGEEDLETRLAAIGKTPKAGQEVRLLNIRVYAEDIMDTHGYESEELIDLLNRNVERYYGTAGPEFVRYVVANLPVLQEHLPEAVHKRAAYLRRNLGECAGQVIRVSSRFALYWIAGSLAVKFGILPHSEDEIQEAVRLGFDRWIEHRGGVLALEEQQYIDLYAEHFSLHEANYVVNTPVAREDTELYPRRCPNPLYGYIDRTPGQEGVYYRVSSFKNIAKEAGKDPKRALQILVDHGYLPLENTYTRPNRLYQCDYTIYWENGQFIEKGKRVLCYRIVFPETYSVNASLDEPVPSDVEVDKVPF